MDNIEQLLAFDALDTAEKITGKSYKEDGVTTAFGLLLQAENSERKIRALQDSEDVHSRITFVEYLGIATRLGFKLVHEEQFTAISPFKEEEPVEETFCILFHPDKGLLLRLESYSRWYPDGARVNTAELYFNFEPTEKVWPTGGFSGGLCRNTDRYVYVGHKDVREGLWHFIQNMEQQGEFLSVWIEQPFLWLLTYMDSNEEGYDCKKISAQRISQLPSGVQEAIAGE